MLSRLSVFINLLYHSQQRLSEFFTAHIRRDRVELYVEEMADREFAFWWSSEVLRHPFLSNCADNVGKCPWLPPHRRGSPADAGDARRGLFISGLDALRGHKVRPLLCTDRGVE